MRHIFAFLLFTVTAFGQSELATNIFVTQAGPWATNCYLIWNNNEAAIIDAGTPIDTLLTIIKEKDLILKYLFITHCHQDHISGVKLIKEKYPDVKLVVSEVEFGDIEFYSDWENLFDEKSVSAWKADDRINRLMNMDYSEIGTPNIFADDGQEFELGNTKVISYHTPGHSRGSLSYYTEGALFPGDLIYFNSVGYLDYKFSTEESITESVRRLYELVPDETVIYSGHGTSSTIAREKEANRVVKPNETFWK
ncbi:MAG: MBL fold metallo-hydrolase [Bacteroidetes bacterium]|nr:MBL fold metallo-hydrolase [Bacteroidota bacterium]